MFSTTGMYLSNFSLISGFFKSTSLKIIFEISTSKHVSCDFIIDSDFRKSVFINSDFFSLNPTYIRANRILI